MPKRTKPSEPRHYRIRLKPSVHRARRRLPGNVRQRIKRLIDKLGQAPRPPRSRALELPDTVSSEIREQWEVRRARLESWRVIYAINEQWREIGVLAVVKRPPYRYEDLEALLEDLGGEYEHPPR